MPQTRRSSSSASQKENAGVNASVEGKAPLKKQQTKSKHPALRQRKQQQQQQEKQCVFAAPRETDVQNRRKSLRSSTNATASAPSSAPCTPGPSGTSVDALPNECLQLIGSHLSLMESLKARTVCKRWSAEICAANDNAGIQLHPDVNAVKRKVDLIARLQPLATTFTVTVGGSALSSRLEASMKLLASLQRLQYLKIEFLVPQTSQISMGVVRSGFVSLRPVSHLKGLRSLTIESAPMYPLQEDLLALSTCTQLTKLVVSVQEQQGRPLSYLSVSDRKPNGILALKSLRHLEVPAFMLDYGPLARHPDSITPLVMCPFSHPLPEALKHLTTLVASGLPLSMHTFDGVVKLGALKELDIEPLQEVRFLDLEKPQLETVGVKMDEYPQNEETAELAESRLVDLRRLGGKLKRLAFRTSTLTKSNLELMSSFPTLESLSIESTGNEGDCTKAELHRLKSLPLKHFSYRKAIPLAVPMAFSGSHFDNLLATWAPTLTNLSLEGLTSKELFPGTTNSSSATSPLSSLSRLKHLKALKLVCLDQSPTMVQLDTQWLPASLESLHLKWFILTSAEQPTHLAGLNSLTLTCCTCPGFLHFKNLMEGLPDLKSLELEDYLNMSEKHILQLRPLTQLTNLGLVAISNHHINNSMLGHLTTLGKLRRLKWHAGDMLDGILDPAFLKAFPKLHVLSITTSMFYRMTRWSALNVMEFLPFCQIETVGP